MSQPALYRDDPETGPERFCRRCDEWWPYDGEFWWYPNQDRSALCKACSRRHGRLWQTSRRARERAKYSAPRLCRICLMVWSQNVECHGCAGRIAGPLTAAKLAEWGLAGVR